LIVAVLAAPAPAGLAQDGPPSGRELRETYPLRENSPKTNNADRARTANNPDPARTPAAPAAARPSDTGSNVQPIIAAGLILLAFAIGFVLPRVQPSARPPARRRGSGRFQANGRSADRVESTAPSGGRRP